MSVTEIIESYAVRPVMNDATLGDLGMDSLDVVAMQYDIEEAEGLNIPDGKWGITTRVQRVLDDVAALRGLPN